MTTRLDAADICVLLERLRTGTPLVQCLTNTVVTNFTANVLLAIGATPAMTDIPTEAGLFAEIASATLVNVGTPHAEQRIAMIEAAQAAHHAGTPWVLDPVAVGVLPVRTALALELLEYSPTAIRGNASEGCSPTCRTSPCGANGFVNQPGCCCPGDCQTQWRNLPSG